MCGRRQLVQKSLRLFFFHKQVQTGLSGKNRFLLQRIPVAQPFRLSEQIEGHGKENFTRFHAARQLGSVQRSRRRVGISPHKSARAQLYAAEVTGHNHRGVDKLLLLDYVQYGLARLALRFAVVGKAFRSARGKRIAVVRRVIKPLCDARDELRRLFFVRHACGNGEKTGPFNRDFGF